MTRAELPDLIRTDPALLQAQNELRNWQFEFEDYVRGRLGVPTGQPISPNNIPLDFEMSEREWKKLVADFDLAYSRGRRGWKSARAKVMRRVWAKNQAELRQFERLGIAKTAAMASGGNPSVLSSDLRSFGRTEFDHIIEIGRAPSGALLADNIELVQRSVNNPLRTRIGRNVFVSAPIERGRRLSLLTRVEELATSLGLDKRQRVRSLSAVRGLRKASKLGGPLGVIISMVATNKAIAQVVETQNQLARSQRERDAEFGVIPALNAQNLATEIERLMNARVGRITRRRFGRRLDEWFRNRYSGGAESDVETAIKDGNTTLLVDVLRAIEDSPLRYRDPVDIYAAASRPSRIDLLESALQVARADLANEREKRRLAQALEQLARDGVMRSALELGGGAVNSFTDPEALQKFLDAPNVPARELRAELALMGKIRATLEAALNRDRLLIARIRKALDRAAAFDGPTIN